MQEDYVSMNSPKVQLMTEAEGESLMIRKTLLKEPVKEDTTQRRALFSSLMQGERKVVQSDN